MNKSSVLVFACVAVSVTAGCSSRSEQTTYCPPAVEVDRYHRCCDPIEPVTPISINDFNRKSYEGPIVDGEVHLERPISSRFALMQMPHGKDSLYVIRHVDMNFNRFDEQDIAFLALSKKNATVVTSNNLATVVAPSDKRNEFNYIQTPIDNKGYQGRVEWKSLKGLDGIARRFVEFELGTAISIDNMPYALAFAKVKSYSGTEVGVVTFDLTTNNFYQYTKLMNYSGHRSLHGNAMYVNHYDNIVTVSVLDKIFKYTHKTIDR